MGWRDIFSENAPGTQSTQSTKPPVWGDCVDIVDSVLGVAREIPSSEPPSLAPVDQSIVARRWPGFVARAVAYGATREEVGDRFTDEDRADLCAPEHDDARLATCARTIADVILSERILANAALTPSPTARTVQCVACRHFAPRATSPAFGACGRDVPSSGATTLHHATHRHPCGSFAEVSR